MKSTAKKRLDEIEIQLTPKEWAIRLADEIRKYPSVNEFNKAYLKVPDHESIVSNRPYRAIAKQVELQFPGNKPDEIRAHNAQMKRLWLEYDMLRNIVFTINKDVSNRIEIYGLKAALKLSTLQTVILQDAFGRTASKAAEWIEDYKTADEDDEENRQIMLKELAAYTEVSFAERFSDSIPLGQGIRLRFPSLIEEWVRDVKSLIGNVYARKSAVDLIQKKHFDGHSFLFLDTEKKLEETMKTIQAGVETFNDYLMTRELFFKAEWDEEDEEMGMSSAIPGEREGQLSIDLDLVKTGAKGFIKILAEEWIKSAREDAVGNHLMMTDRGKYNEHLRAIMREAYEDRPDEK